MNKNSIEKTNMINTQIPRRIDNTPFRG